MFQNLDALAELFASEDKHKSDLAYTKTVNWQQSIYCTISKTNGLAIVFIIFPFFLSRANSASIPLGGDLVFSWVWVN